MTWTLTGLKIENIVYRVVRVIVNFWLQKEPKKFKCLSFLALREL